MRIRLTVVALSAVAALTTLSGCVADNPGRAVDWLGGQQGIAGTEVLAEHSDIVGSTGLVRGELAPDLDDAGLERLIDSVQGYLTANDEVAIRLGRGDIDFAVSTDDEATAASIDLWHQVSDLDHLANAVVYTDPEFGSDVHARTLRAEAVGALDELDQLVTETGIHLELESFRTVDGIAHDTEEDDFFGSDIGNRLAFAVHWAPDCTPPGEERGLVEEFMERDDIDGAQLVLCDSFDVYFGLDASLSQVVPALRSQLDEAGLSLFPVWVRQQFDAYPDGRSVAVTPGDATALAVIDVFETPGAPPAYFELTPDRSLDVSEYGTPTADLLALVSASPVAATLPLIVIEGTDVAISGTLAELQVTLAQAVALATSSDQYGGIELSPTTGTVSLQSPVATDPDVVRAAADLRASGAWQGRTFTVIYLSTQLTIVGGVATVGDPNYTDGHVVQGFVDAWNAG